MQIEDFLQDYQSKVKPYWQNFFSSWQKQAKQTGVIPEQILEKFVELYPKGKQFRGALVVLAYHLSGGKRQACIYKASMMVELLQTAGLIADDVYDNDEVRRGQPTIHIQWAQDKPLHYGYSMAFNTANIGFYLAPLALEHTNFEPDVKIKALNYFFKKAVEVGWGQGWDMSTPYISLAAKQSSAQYIHDFKTVSYSGVLPLMLGAILAGQQDKKWLATLEQYGQCLGRIFQIQDDIIGSFGDESQTGKTNSGDIREAKWTVLIEILYQKLKEADKKTFERLFAKKVRNDQNIATIKQFMRTYKVVEAAQSQAQDYFEEGLKLIPELTDNKKHQDTLKNLLEFMLSRNK
ncbi:hypothetical protein GYA49_02360 [Candidatus Beckwithbacteria bacterium]|nr:hypothetical protein [Candidatus Beckwithbacteria bacterium]